MLQLYRIIENTTVCYSHPERDVNFLGLKNNIPCFKQLFFEHLPTFLKEFILFLDTSTGTVKFQAMQTEIVYLPEKADEIINYPLKIQGIQH